MQQRDRRQSYRCRRRHPGDVRAAPTSRRTPTYPGYAPTYYAAVSDAYIIYPWELIVPGSAGCLELSCSGLRLGGALWGGTTSAAPTKPRAVRAAGGGDGPIRAVVDPGAATGYDCPVNMNAPGEPGDHWSWRRKPSNRASPKESSTKMSLPGAQDHPVGHRVHGRILSLIALTGNRLFPL